MFASLLVLVPEPLGGTVIVGQDTLVYLNKDRQCPIAPPVMKVRAALRLCRVMLPGIQYVSSNALTESLTINLAFGPVLFLLLLLFFLFVKRGPVLVLAQITTDTRVFVL